MLHGKREQSFIKAEFFGVVWVDKSQAIFHPWHNRIDTRPLISVCVKVSSSSGTRGSTERKREKGKGGSGSGSGKRLAGNEIFAAATVVASR